MGRAPCCDKANVKKGPWSPEEDAKLKKYIEKFGAGGNWIALPQKAGLRRCGKSCRLRWLNYLRPNIKHGDFTDNEDRIICSLFASIGSRWSVISAQLPGRTDNDIKNYWNTKLKKKLMGTMVPASQTSSSKTTPWPSVLSVLDQPPFVTSSPRSTPSPSLSSTTITAYKCADDNYYSNPTRLLSGGYETFPNVSPTILNSTRSMHSYQGSQDSFPRFGGVASCSSSDGSSNNQISCGKDTEHRYGLDFQNYLYNGIDENQNITCNSFDQMMKMKPGGCYGENPLNYSLEEIQQLISTNICNNFFVDEIKTEERVAY